MLSSFWQRHRVQSFWELRGELRRFLDERGVPAEAAVDLVLATQEACNNACQHGEDGAGCTVSAICLEGTMMIEVADRGRGFDFETVKRAWPPVLLSSGGRGLFMIAQLTDHVEVVRRRSGTSVRMFKAVE